MENRQSYELVHSPTPADLSLAVEERIGEGWWPLGTPFVHGEHYIQAMVHDPSPNGLDLEEIEDIERTRSSR